MVFIQAPVLFVAKHTTFGCFLVILDASRRRSTEYFDKRRFPRLNAYLLYFSVSSDWMTLLDTLGRRNNPDLRGVCKPNPETPPTRSVRRN